MHRDNNNGSRASFARGFMTLCAMLLAYSVLGVAATVPSTPVHAQSFSGLGFLPGGDSSTPQGVNADGTVVVGLGNATGIGQEAFRWTRAGGMAGLGFLTGGSNSTASGVNADGTVVVGSGGSGQSSEAFRWTQAGGMVGLGFLTGGNFSGASGVNADGTVVVGAAGGEAFRWTQAGGMVGLGFRPGGTFSGASGVNADGTVVIGAADIPGIPDILGPPVEPFRWTQAGGLAGLGCLFGIRCRASGVNADGTVVVGFAGGGAARFPLEAFRWTQAGGMVGLGFLPRGGQSEAFGVNADGTVVVGDAQDEASFSFVAIRWTQTDGIQSVQELLTAKGVDTTGWTLRSAQGVSADGQVIVGVGRDPNGRTQGWIANLGPITVPFLAFKAKLEIDLDRKPNKDRFELESHFTLSSTASNGINPVAEPVTLQIGTFSITIPPGSFKRHRDGDEDEDEDEDEHEHGHGHEDVFFTFHGVFDGVRLEALIKRTGTLRYAFHAEGKGVNLTGTKNPVQVMLTIGNDSGTASVKARISHSGEEAHMGGIGGNN